jgi:hypothetical protein
VLLFFVLFVFFLCLVCTKLPISLDFPLLIAPSFSLTFIPLPHDTRSVLYGRHEHRSLRWSHHRSHKTALAPAVASIVGIQSTAWIMLK